jgi:hypothetical protein
MSKLGAPRHLASGRTCSCCAAASSAGLCTGRLARSAPDGGADGPIPCRAGRCRALARSARRKASRRAPAAAAAGCCCCCSCCCLRAPALTRARFAPGRLERDADNCSRPPTSETHPRAAQATALACARPADPSCWRPGAAAKGGCRRLRFEALSRLAGAWRWRRLRAQDQSLLLPTLASLGPCEPRPASFNLLPRLLA